MCLTVTERKSRNLNQRKLKNRRNAILTFFSTTTTTRLIIVVVVVLVVYDVVVVVVLVLVVVSYPDKNERRTHDVTLKTKSNFLKSTVSLTDRLVKKTAQPILVFHSFQQKIQK